jgi:hypothetical protein
MTFRFLPLLAFFAALVTSGSGASLPAASAVAWAEEGYGYAYNVKTIEEAERLALESCRKNGCSNNIRILTSSPGEGHAALAVDGSIMGAAVGFPDPNSARERAVQECLNNGGKFPRVILTWYDRGY